MPMCRSCCQSWPEAGDRPRSMTDIKNPWIFWDILTWNLVERLWRDLALGAPAAAVAPEWFGTHICKSPLCSHGRPLWKVGRVFRIWRKLNQRNKGNKGNKLGIG